MKKITYLLKVPILKRLLPSLIRNIFILIKKENFSTRFKELILEINIRDPLDREIYLTKEYEEKQFNYLFKLIKNNQINIFLDVGANSGIYSLILSNKFDRLIIEAFEPIKITYEKFIRNAKKNKLKEKIIFHNFGLSNTNNYLKMKTNIKFGYRQSAGYSVSESGDEKAQFKIADEVLSYKNKNILIKIDTEGHEYNVIIGMKQLMKNNNIFLQVEIWTKNFNIIKELLDNNGFIFIKRIKDDYYFYKKRIN